MWMTCWHSCKRWREFAAIHGKRGRSPRQHLVQIGSTRHEPGKRATLNQHLKRGQRINHLPVSALHRHSLLNCYFDFTGGIWLPHAFNTDILTAASFRCRFWTGLTAFLSGFFTSGACWIETSVFLPAGGAPHHRRSYRSSHPDRVATVRR